MIFSDHFIADIAAGGLPFIARPVHHLICVASIVRYAGAHKSMFTAIADCVIVPQRLTRVSYTTRGAWTC